VAAVAAGEVVAAFSLASLVELAVPEGVEVAVADPALSPKPVRGEVRSGRLLRR
jgi:hypothetical protein